MDKETFRYLFNTYYNALCNYACLSLGMSNDAEDIVMEVFAHIWDKRDVLQEIENPKAYLFRSVHHKALEKMRAKKLVIVALEGEKIVVPDYKEEIADDYLLKEKIFQSIRQLPTQCRVIFVKSKLEGMSHKEIAHELQIAVKTVENQITKAFKLIRKQIDTI